jgi:hypothetical protein
MRAPCPLCVPPPPLPQDCFYAVHIISKESKQLVLPNTSGSFFLSCLQSAFLTVLFVSFLPYTLIAPSALLQSSISICLISSLAVINFYYYSYSIDLCGLVVRVFGYRSRDPELDSWRYQTF